MPKAPELVFLGREAILALQDRRRDVVDVPEWGTSLRIRALSAKEVDGLETARIVWIRDDKGNRTGIAGFSSEGQRARIVALGVIDEEGHPLFDAKDIAAIGDKSDAALDRVSLAVMKLTATVTPEKVKAAELELKADPSSSPDSN